MFRLKPAQKKPGGPSLEPKLTEAKPKIPIIRIDDYEEDPPMAVQYICKENELEPKVVNKKIAALWEHPGRGRFWRDPGMQLHEYNLKECDQSFQDAFWECAANLLDYIADFLRHDLLIMQSIWFHLVDKLQEVNVELPHRIYGTGVPGCDHGPQFLRNYEEFLKLANGLISHRKVQPGDALAGLKPWQNYLYSGGPGFVTPESDRVYPNPKQMLDGPVSEQFLPPGALAIIQKHTERQRQLTAKFAKSQPNGRSEADVLYEFDQRKIQFGSSYRYTSIDGRETLVQPMHPKRGSPSVPRRNSGFSDPDMWDPKPDLRLLDEAIGIYKGSRPFVHPSGNDDFHMLHVTTSKEYTPGKLPKVDPKEYHDMFDDWFVGRRG